MDPPYTIEAFVEKQPKIAVHVTSDEYFTRFVEELRNMSIVPPAFSPIQYDHETVLVCAKMGIRTQILQPSLSLAKELRFTIAEASEFFEPNSASNLKVEGLLEELLCL